MQVILNKNVMRKAMVKQNHNISTIAKETGLTRTTVRRALQGYKVKLETATKLASLLDVATLELVKKMG